MLLNGEWCLNTKWNVNVLGKTLNCRNVIFIHTGTSMTTLGSSQHVCTSKEIVFSSLPTSSIKRYRKLGNFTWQSGDNDEEMYQNVWCTCRVPGKKRLILRLTFSFRCFKKAKTCLNISWIPILMLMTLKLFPDVCCFGWTWIETWKNRAHIFFFIPLQEHFVDKGTNWWPPYC